MKRIGNKIGSLAVEEPNSFRIERKTVVKERPNRKDERVRLNLRLWDTSVDPVETLGIATLIPTINELLRVGIDIDYVFVTQKCIDFNEFYLGSMLILCSFKFYFAKTARSLLDLHLKKNLVLSYIPFFRIRPLFSNSSYFPTLTLLGHFRASGLYFLYFLPFFIRR